MKLRLGVVLAAAMTAVMTACGSAGSSGTTSRAPTPGGEVLAPGESPRENQYTREAAGYMEEAQEAEGPADALWQQAVDAAQMAIEQDSTNPLPYYQQGVAYIQLDEYQMADAALDRAEDLRPVYQLETESFREQAWIAKYQEAVGLINSGDVEGGVAQLEEANMIYDRRPEIFFALGSLYSQLDRPQDAIDALESAQAIIESDRIEEMDSTTQASWRESAEQIPSMIAQALMQTGDYGAAASAIRGLLAEDPNNPMLLRNLANLYVEMEQPDSAAAVYDRLLQQPNLQPTTLYSAGIGYYNLDDFIKAADAFDRVIELAPRDRDAVEMLNRSLQLEYLANRGDSVEVPAAAIERISEAAALWQELDPNSSNAYLVGAQVANVQGNGEEAGRMIQMIEQLPVVMQNLQLQRYADGGGIVTGAVMNQSLDQGTPVTVEFTFYGEGGNVIGTQNAQLTAGPADSPVPLQVDFASDQTVRGYSYEVRTM